MELRSLGRSGLKVSPLCLGAMTFGASPGSPNGITCTDEEAARILDMALDAGIQFVDTANVYSEGRSEDVLGRLLAGRRPRVVVATKCRFPNPDDGPNDRGLSRRAIVAACEASLRRLRTDWIDLYQVHMQDRRVPIEETLRALDDLVTSGKVRYVGCSNYAGYRLMESLWAADRRGTARYESVQLQWSLVVRGAEREVIPACREFGLGVLVWSPLKAGFLSGKYRRGEPAPAGSRLESWKDTWAMLQQEQSWRTLDVVRTIAARRGTSPSAIALAWVLRRPETTSVILGARSVDQLRDNLACLEVRLTPDDERELDEVSRPDWGYPYDFIGAREPW